VASPPSARSKRLSAADGILHFQEHDAEEIQKARKSVQGNLKKVQLAFESVAAFAPIDEASKNGWMMASKTRRQMWELLSFQVESGLGPPSQQQLDLLWRKYDGNNDLELSMTEVRAMLVDVAGAMIAYLKNVQKDVEFSLKHATSPFERMLATTFKLTNDAQMKLFSSHVDGRLTEDEVAAAFASLDVNHDGHVTKDEFMEKAGETFFGILLEHAKMHATLSHIAEEALDVTSPKPTAANATLPHSDALSKAMREAREADGAIKMARKRIDDHVRGREILAARVIEGTRHLLDGHHKMQAELRREVQAERAAIQVDFELSAKESVPSQMQRAQIGRMWTLMSKQLIAGQGAPRESQLGAIFDKYADPKSHSLSKGDLSMAMMDYAQARVEEITRHELPAMMDYARPGGGESTKNTQLHADNEFVQLLTNARRMSKEAELALCRAQAGGSMSPAELARAFKTLDVDGDGLVYRHEFVSQATDVFFSIQLGRVHNWSAFEEAAASVG